MGVRIYKNSLFLKKDNNSEMVPAIMFGTGADVAVEEITRIANESKEQVEGLRDVIDQANETISSLQDLVTDSGVNEIKQSVDNLNAFSVDGMVVCHDEGGYYIDTSKKYNLVSNT